MLQVGVDDGMSSFGRGLSSGLAALPTQFDPTRNPIDGSIDPCVFGQDGGGCLTPQLGSTTAIQYRNRGVQALLSSRYGRWSYGVGIGYNQRRLPVPATSLIAALDGTRDESVSTFRVAALRVGQENGSTVSTLW